MIETNFLESHGIPYTVPFLPYFSMGKLSGFLLWFHKYGGNVQFVNYWIKWVFLFKTLYTYTLSTKKHCLSNIIP